MVSAYFISHLTQSFCKLHAPDNKVIVDLDQKK